MKTTLSLKFAIFSAVLLGSIFGASSQAAVYAAPAQRPMTITAVCVTAAAGTAQWRIGNPNPFQIAVSWTDAATQSAQSVTPSYGYTTVTTTYDTTSAAPSVTFEQAGLPDQTVAVSATACTQPIQGCVDGYARDNLSYNWSKDGTVTVKTVNDAPLCADVPVYLSAYTLPATYDESGVFDDSSVPQEKFASTSAVLKAGTNGNTTLQIAVPNACTDYQLDLYYDPEITEISYGGHGAQLIYGDIYLHTMTDCSKPTGGSGGNILGESTTQPAQLADTGASTIVPTIAALLIAFSAAIVEFSIPAKLKNLLAQ